MDNLEKGPSRGRKMLGALMSGAAMAGSPEIAAGQEQAVQMIQMDHLEYAALHAGLTSFQLERVEKAGCTFEADGSEFRIQMHGFTQEHNPGDNANLLVIKYGQGEKILSINMADDARIESLDFKIFDSRILREIKFVLE